MEIVASLNKIKGSLLRIIKLKAQSNERLLLEQIVFSLESISVGQRRKIEYLSDIKNKYRDIIAKISKRGIYIDFIIDSIVYDPPTFLGNIDIEKISIDPEKTFWFIASMMNIVRKLDFVDTNYIQHVIKLLKVLKKQIHEKSFRRLIDLIIHYIDKRQQLEESLIQNVIEMYENIRALDLRILYGSWLLSAIFGRKTRTDQLSIIKQISEGLLNDLEAILRKHSLQLAIIAVILISLVEINIDKLVVVPATLLNVLDEIAYLHKGNGIIDIYLSRNKISPLAPLTNEQPTILEIINKMYLNEKIEESFENEMINGKLIQGTLLEGLAATILTICGYRVIRPKFDSEVSSRWEQFVEFEGASADLIIIDDETGDIYIAECSSTTELSKKIGTLKNVEPYVPKAVKFVFITSHLDEKSAVEYANSSKLSKRYAILTLKELHRMYKLAKQKNFRAAKNILATKFWP